jgi:hypothetical protein
MAIAAIAHVIVAMVLAVMQTVKLLITPTVLTVMLDQRYKEIVIALVEHIIVP